MLASLTFLALATTVRTSCHGTLRRRNTSVRAGAHLDKGLLKKCDAWRFKVARSNAPAPARASFDAAFAAAPLASARAATSRPATGLFYVSRRRRGRKNEDTEDAQAAQKSFETWAPHAYAETTSRDPWTCTRAAPLLANRTPKGARGAGGRSTTGVSSPAELSDDSSSAVEWSSSSDHGMRAAAPTAHAAPASSASERIPNTRDSAIESFGEESRCRGAARHVVAKAPFSNL